MAAADLDSRKAGFGQAVVEWSRRLVGRPRKRFDFDSLLINDYYEVYSEAHRRRPTLFNFPCASLHVAIYYPGKFPEAQPFLKFLFETFRGWNLIGEASAQGFDPDNASRQVYEFYSRSVTEPRQERVLFDFACQRKAGSVWRIVCQREYVAITLQTKFDLVEAPGGGFAVRSSFFGEGSESVERVAAAVSGDGGASAVVAMIYDDLQAAMRRELDVVVIDAINKWNESPLQGDYTRRRPEIFVNFFGCTAPWQMFAGRLATQRTPGEGPTVNQPLFPNPASGGFAEGLAMTDRMAPTERFLADIWVTISGHVMDSNYNDSVACYLENGHTIYISNLGSQKDTVRKYPLKYILLYDREAFDRHDAQAALAGARAALARSAAWRLSRLLNRLHDIGTVRLAALRNVGAMLQFSEQLRHVEYDLQHNRAEFENLHKLNQIDERLTRYGEGMPDLIMDRAYKTDRYYKEVVTLSEDLGTVAIPTWQSYDKFIRRRLYTTLEIITGLGNRYQAARDTISNINNTNIATKVFSLQSTAEGFAAILLFHYIPEILIELVRQAWPWLQAHSTHLPVAKWSPDSAEHWAYLIGLAFAAVFAFWRHIRNTWRAFSKWWRRSRNGPSLLPQRPAHLDRFRPDH